MGDRIEGILVPVMLLGCMLLAVYIAIFRPGYLSDSYYLAALIFLQVLVAVLWDYRQRFFPLLVVAFLWAGTALPGQGVWTMGRWFVLAMGALAGFAIYMRDRRHTFSSFHLVAFFCVVAAMVSAMVSSYGSIALLKAASLLLLFLYGVAGARVAVLGREAKFVAGLLLGIELLVYFTAVSYFVLHLELFDNPNSLGAVMGVVATPVMLWGSIVADKVGLRRRRTSALILALVLVVSSYARAGMAAAAVSSILLCVALRRYRLLLRGLGAAVLIAMLIVTIRPLHVTVDSDAEWHSVTDILVYKGQREHGLLGSRKSAWDRTSDVIHEHPWFGSGFGTSVTRAEVADQGWVFESSGSATREHGNSYLAITEWVGLLGMGPFFVLIFLIVTRVCRVAMWMRRTGNAFSTAVPLAAVMAAGLVHAMFEDWLFAVGYYLCIFFWTLAFVLVDVMPADAPAIIRARAPQPSADWTNNVPAFVAQR